jgi:hypothetical protein
MTLKRVAALEVVVVGAICSYVVYGAGQDLFQYYLPFASGCLECGFNPWYASWILAPLRFVPVLALRPLWTAFTLAALIWSSERLGSRWAVVLLSFPTLGLIWLGQIDGIIAIGLTLAVTSASPYLRGFGLVLALVKPQVAGLAALVLPLGLVIWVLWPHLRRMVVWIALRRPSVA